MTEEAKQEAVNHPEFNANKLLATLRQTLVANDVLTAEEDPMRDRIEVVLTSVRVRSTFSAIMWGAMAGDDHLNGNVFVRGPSGEPAQTFSVTASYALGGLIGGQDEARMGWLYQTFVKHIVEELTGKSEVVEVGPVEPVEASPIPTVGNSSPSTTTGFSGSPTRMRALFSGTRLSRDQGSDRIIEEFAADGTVIGKRLASGSGEQIVLEQDKGSWSTDNEGRLCLGWAKWNDGKTSCHAISTGNKTIRLLSPNGAVITEYAVLNRPRRASAPKTSIANLRARVVGRSFTRRLQSGNLRIIRFERNGKYSGEFLGSFGGTVTESGRWTVTKDDKLCVQWNNWYSGKRICFNVTDRNGELVMRARRLSFVSKRADAIEPAGSGASETKNVVIPDGPILGEQIKALLVGRRIASEHSVIIAQSSSTATRSDCYVSHVFESSTRVRSVCKGEKIGRWWIQENSLLCGEWGDWYYGQQQCYQVLKSSNKITFIDKAQQSTVFKIEN
jgi:hypothetical protein